MDGGGNVAEAGVLDVLQSAEMDGERVVNYCRAALIVVGTIDLVVVRPALTPLAARWFFLVGLVTSFYVAALFILLRDRRHHYPRLKYITVSLDIALIYATTVAAFLNYSGVYAVYRSPLMWLLLAGSNAMSGLRHSARASLFSGTLTLVLGFVELALLARLPIHWSNELHFVGPELNLTNCIQTIVWTAMPAWYAAAVAHRSRRLVLRSAREARERAQAEELAATTERFVSIASHELRSPVAALHASVQLLTLDPGRLADADARRRIVERLGQRSERLVKLVDQLLDSTRLNRREIPLERRSCDLAQLCRDSVGNLDEASAARVAIATDGPVVGTWDASRLEQVVVNLVGNALRYSPPDAQVELRVTQAGSHAVIEVADHGIGIPAAQLDQIFTPFFRADKARSADRSGVGLGLYITHEIVQRHGGTIHVSSREGAGTRFTVELPLAPP